jgi:OmpR-family two-component system manganese-sensing response regulator
MKEQSFDLYILDYSLPEISGLELCHFIRKNNPSKPIMFLTAMAYPIHRASGLTAGADEYLIKPNDLGELIETINQLLNANSSSTCDTPNKLQESNSIF